MKQSFLQSKKFLYVVIALLVLVILGIGGVFGYEKYQTIRAEKQVEKIHSILDTGIKSYENCKKILGFQSDKIDRSKVDFRDGEYQTFKNSCSVHFDISKKELSKEFCSEIISGRKKDFQNRYIVLDDFTTIQQKCSSKYLHATFHTGALFDVENDFKSSIGVTFGLPFYKDVENAESEGFIANRTVAKQRFIDLLEVKPRVNITLDDIVLHPKSGTLLLDLLPETKYSFSLKSFEAEGMEGEKIQSETFEITTPKNVAFGIRVEEKVSLFRDTDQPNFELYSYNSGKNGAKIKICRIPNEEYAKIEVFTEQKGMREEKKNFFHTGIDKLNTYECQEKEVSFGETSTGTLKKASFNFASEIGEVARSGLYYVTFADSADRKTEEKVQRPLFFGVIDSHITMKISRNGKAFFFVNDFAGKPLKNQEIRVYANNFISKEKKWNGPKKDYDIHYVNPLEKSVFDTPIFLGKTNKQGILEVDMKGKLDDAFLKTFRSYDFDWSGNYNSFFVTSASETNLTYTSSKWNGGIRGWNFGYSQGYGWWYGESENMDEISLDSWGRVEPKIYSHTYTDRKLYLPGEKVFIKSILRNSEDLSIPKGKQVTVQIKNPKGKDAAQSMLSVSDYGSIHSDIELPDDAILGSYQVLVKDGDEVVGRTAFSVEVFKNPKFKNELMLETSGLDHELIQNVKEEVKENSWGYKRKNYTAKFDIKASLSSDYYSGSPVKNAKFTYKVYKQYYYDNSYWDDCYYGCYWEPEKIFYSEGNGVLDANGKASFSVPVEFSSRYNDYKYIVEATVVDSAGDKISGSNSVIARLPEKYKRWNPESGVYFKTEKRFYKQGEEFSLDGGLTQGNFGSEYFDDFILVIKKKNYITHYVKDVRGQERPITKAQEIVEKILPVNDKNFTLKDGKLSLNYKLKETGEYVFEFGKISDDIPFDTQKLIAEFQKDPSKELKKTYDGKILVNWENWGMLQKYCAKSETQSCSRQSILNHLQCNADRHINDSCEGQEKVIQMEMGFTADNLFDANSKKYFTLISYGDKNAQNPVESDNKITVLSEKVSYKLGEKARVLVRLPFSGGKILWTIEKQGVMKHEYIDVPGNTFFKEFKIDDSFVPNAYIGVTVIDTDNSKVPEYKVGYTEIVVDKTDKKSDIRITPNKKTYEPREEVSLKIKAEKQSELTVMVVDDSLISLMGNVDTNTLEKFYKKLPFQIQTSITNIAMLRNYYFSRQGIVGGSGFGNFKGGDSAVSSRNIFKNTAYYNPSVITDGSGNAKVTFTLPDNLTNFRVMVLSNSKDNFFGYAQEMIEVRKEVLLEDRTPLILREGDEITLGANVFNMSEKEIGFKASISADGLKIENAEKNIQVPAGESKFISWKVTNTQSCPYLKKKCEIPYMISLLGDSAKHSDKLEGAIEIKHIPSLITNTHRSETLEAGESAELNIALPENTDIEKSLYTLSLSNNPLQGIGKIVKSLAVYPFGCGEQLLSSTLPNAVLQRFTSLLPDAGISQSTINENLSHGLDKIYDMSLENGAFKYWYHDTQGNIHITAYGVRVLREIQKSGTSINVSVLEKAAKYLTSNYKKAEGIEKAESLWALADYYRGDTSAQLGISDLTIGYTPEKLSRHELIAYTYGLVLADSKKYASTIDANISRIETLLEEGKEGSYYYSLLSDMGEFTQLLMDYKADKKMITKYISKMYDRDWESYWYSTKTKSNAFLAFAKYIELYGKDNKNTLSLTLNGNTADVELGGDNTNNYKKDITLSKVLTGDFVNLSVKNVSGGTLFTSANIQSYPLDPLKITPFSDGVKLSRKIYEVVDSSNISETCRWRDGNRTCTEASGLKLHSGNEFKKGATYKVVLEAQFNESKRRQNLTMEDYIPAGFTILNSKFKTNEIATNQETSNEDSWRWSHVERNPDVVMAHAKSIWGSSARYEYFIRADFAGEFIYPPAVVYLMYQPDTRANSVFRRVVVR